jgi:hypothetical protein
MSRYAVSADPACVVAGQNLNGILCFSKSFPEARQKAGRTPVKDD